MDDFCVFILSHGRAKNVKTFSTLKSCGYTGKIFLVVDSEDEAISDYVEVFGSASVIIFDKKKIEETFDRADNRSERGSVVFARNACWSIARNLGFRYFIQLDDDYSAFHHCRPHRSLPTKKLDSVFSIFLKCSKQTF